MVRASAFLGCCILALGAGEVFARGAVPLGAGKLRQINPSSFPSPARLYTEVSFEFAVTPEDDDWMVGIGLGSVFDPAPAGLEVERVTLDRLDPTEPRAKSVVLPWIAQTRGALLEDGGLPGSTWFGFTAALDHVPELAPGEVFSVRFVLSVEREEIDGLKESPVQFAGAGVLPDGTPILTAGGPGSPAVFSSPRELGACIPTQHQLCLSEGRFRAEASWQTAAATGQGIVDPFPTDLSGNIAFFEPSNVEILVKVLDGKPLNGHCWVFHSATTNVEYTLTVTDTQTGRVKTYNNPQGRIAVAVLDTVAFECG